LTPEASIPRDVLAAEILEDARRKSERLLAQARREADAVLAQARDRGARERQELVDAARAEAARRRERILAGVPVQQTRLLARRVEQELESLREEADGQLRELAGVAARETLVRLAVQAVAGMAGPRFVVHLSEADRALFDEALAAAIRQQAGRSDAVLEPAAEPAAFRGGVVVADPEHLQTWDNSFAARMRRWWPALRRELAAETGLLQLRADVPEDAAR
jgi:vacuolar-type H+-ATPase subunit E/Vma4